MDTKKAMNVWTKEMDGNLLKSVLLYEPYQFKPRTKESGNAWKAISEDLNCIAMFKCIVDARGSRERLTLLKSKRIDTNKYEAKATGINPHITEDDKLMDDIIERCHEFKEIISVERDVDQINQGKDRRAAARHGDCKTWRRTMYRENVMS